MVFEPWEDEELLEAIRTQRVPSEGLEKKRRRYLTRKIRSFRWVEGKEYPLQKFVENQKSWKDFPKREQREKIMKDCHERIGHGNLEHTVKEVQKQYVWPEMREEIIDFVKHCVVCLRATRQPREREPLK